MELKYRKVLKGGFFSKRFNRTFMELKLFRVNEDSNSNFVLIVPLWN